MQIDHKGPGISAFSMGMEPSGREHVVLVTKRTLRFPRETGGTCPWLPGADDLCLADEFTGDPGFSSVIRESDFPLRKPKCDILLTGAAYSPTGSPVERLHATLSFGRMSKTIEVIGDRKWERSIIGLSGSEPAPFDRMEITYDRAFGGIDDLDSDDELPAAFLDNPVGCGWHRRRNRGLIAGTPLPNCEDPRDLIEEPWGHARPMSFGPIGRGWPDRVKWAGTYDEDWLEHRFPHLPDDFDERYYQSAPTDQQVAHPRGGEIVTLTNLVPGVPGTVTMRLPDLTLPVVFSKRRRQDYEVASVVDTVTIEPDRYQISVINRASFPLDRDIFDVEEAIVGKRGKGFWRARKLGKGYNRGLSNIGAGKPKVPQL